MRNYILFILCILIAPIMVYAEEEVKEEVKEEIKEETKIETNTKSVIENKEYICEEININNIQIDNKYLETSGEERANENYGITGYINVNNKKIINKVRLASGSAICFYDHNKTLINCNSLNNYSNEEQIAKPSGTYYIRTSINKQQNKPLIDICELTSEMIARNSETIKKLLIIGIGLLFAIFLTRRKV